MAETNRTVVQDPRTVRLGAGKGRRGIMFLDPSKTIGNEDICLMFAEDPIQTTLHVELRGIQFPSTIEAS
jgi:hypothetical protein